MRAGGGKAKGSQFEREVCTKLALWVTHGKRDDVFWRSSMSGGRATVRGRKGKKTASQAGDISAISEEGHAFLSVFIPECKFVKKLSIQSAMISNEGLLAQYWSVLESEAEKHERRPILIAKENRSPVFAFVWECDGANYFGARASNKLATFYQLESKLPVAVYLLSKLLRRNKYREERFKKK